MVAGIVSTVLLAGLASYQQPPVRRIGAPAAELPDPMNLGFKEGGKPAQIGLSYRAD